MTKLGMRDKFKAKQALTDDRDLKIFMMVYKTFTSNLDYQFQEISR